MQKQKAISGVLVLLACFLATPAISEDTWNWERVRAYTQEHNQDIMVAAQAVEQAEYSYKKSLAAFYPSVSASASLSDSQSGTGTQNKSYSYGVSGSLSLF